MKLRFYIAILIFFFIHTSVSAEEILYRNIMAACQPDAASIKKSSCRTGGHGVFHQGNGGSCRLICSMPVTFSDEQWDGLTLFGKDPDGTGNKYRIQANWKKADLGSNIGKTLCSVDSNNPPFATPTEVTGYAARGCSKPGFTSFHPNRQTWYWLEVIISRTPGSKEDIEVLGFSIF